MLDIHFAKLDTEILTNLFCHILRLCSGKDLKWR